jgi:cytochrome oxidase Cu insertion factor (SCO1/SenC/PrrC family)
MRILITAGLLLALAVSATASSDDFIRENKNRHQKDPLEGKAPPALQVTDWMNTDGKPLTLKSLRGKVVVIDFWGTW